MSDAFLPPVRQSTEPEPTLRDLWTRLGRQWPLIAGTVALVVGVVAIWTFTTRPLYRSTARLQIVTDGTGLPLLDDLESLPGLDLAGFKEGELETEMGILRSRRILEAVVDSLALQVRLEEPARMRHDVVEVLRVDDPDIEAVLELRPTGAGAYRITLRDVKGGDVDPAALPARVAVGEPFTVGGVTLALARGLLADPADEIEIELLPRYEAITDLEDELDIRRQEGGSRLVEVAYVSPDRVLAAGVVNAAVGEYVAYRTGTETSEIVRTAERLRAQVADYADRLAAAEERLREYQESARVIAPEEEATQQVRRLAELQLKLDAVNVERRALRDLLAVIEERAADDNVGAYRQLATFPTFIANGAIQNMLETLVELENERTELLGRRTEANDDVRQLDLRIAELERQLYRLGSEYLQSLDQQHASAAQARESISEEFEALPGRGMRYARLLRDQKVLSEAYLLLEKQLKQAEIREAIYMDDIRVVDPGRISHEDDPAFPKPLVNLLLATVLGLSAGLAIALTRDVWDNRVHGETDAARVAAGIPVLGVIPPPGRSRRRIGSNGTVAVARRRAGPVPVADADPWSEPAEAYRSMATLMAASNGDRPGRVIVVTSPREADGRSSVAANLAVAFAQKGCRTLLVDADLRRGELHALFEAPAEPGLEQLLDGSASLVACVHDVELAHGPEGLSILPSGSAPSTPAELRGRKPVEAALDELRSAYECVVVDAGSLDRSAGASGLSARADAVLVVARTGVTDRGDLQRAVERLRRVSDRVEGIVLASGEGTVRIKDG